MELEERTQKKLVAGYRTAFEDNRN
jgi:hypothetical protein